MISKNTQFALALSLTTLALGAAGCGGSKKDVASPADPAAATTEKGAEGSCGEGKCGEGKCGGDKAATPDGGAAPEGATPEKGGEGSCGSASCGQR